MGGKALMLMFDFSFLALPNDIYFVITYTQIIAENTCIVEANTL